MYDIHYDLLTILYYTFKIDRNSDNLDNFLINLSKIYNSNNIVGGIINLYFMTPQEMIEELKFKEKELENVVKIFRYSINLLENIKTLGFIPEETDFIFGIEGATYIKNLEEIETLYQLGLRSITPVYNTKNKYGSGFKETGGLTEEGSKLIKKMIELGMIIDVSHANEETFFDILNIVEESKSIQTNPIVIASHSNIRELCDQKRNLTKEQLLKLKKVGGYISLFTNGNFISLNNEELSYNKRQLAFLKHVDYLLQEIKFDKEKILIASDDMNFHPDKSYHHLETFPLDKIKEQLNRLLTEQYDQEFARQVMFKNAQNLFDSIRPKQKMYKK